MCTKGGNCKSRLSRQGGLTLVELIMFIVIVSVGIAGILLVLNRATRTSADPVVRKQALAIAESLLEEDELMPFTFCDPDDANATTATSTAGCATIVEALGPEAGETRYSAATPFDNVNDYHGFTMNSGNGGIKDITNTVFPALNPYSASVSVVQESLGTGGAAIPATESLRITVTVTGPGNTTVTLDGYRTRYAPNTTP